MSTIRNQLRQLKSLAGPFQPVDFDAAPETPVALFDAWLQAAIAVGVQEPHAMTVSTVDADGYPDARVLILKDLDARGWHFAIAKSSPKGRQIAANPQVALTFYWPPLGRQVRLRGPALDLGSAAGAADFRARSAEARAGAFLARQSEVLDDTRGLAEGVEQQLRRVAAAPDEGAPDWAVYAVQSREVEFWQGAESRHHLRLLYRREGDGWARLRLWP
jgi:pyridoxamine 5'-phosphate oxidase